LYFNFLAALSAARPKRQPSHDGRVLFAGDTCAEGVALGYVEGAMAAGERAADAVRADERAC